MITVDGLSHITIVVTNLERTADFLTRILGAQEVYSSGEHTFSLSPEKFFLIGGIWLAIMEGEELAERSYNHIAFKVSESSLEECRERLIDIGIDFREDRPRVGGEGRSIYFYDYDNHLFELHSGTLQESLLVYAKKHK
jgi:fosfomycin resistance protein FosX